MTIEEAIAALLAELPGQAYRGRTATEGRLNYLAARSYDFERCDCSCSDQAYEWHEYIAVGTQGHQVVALNLQRGHLFGRVTIGANGFHTRPGRQPACR